MTAPLVDLDAETIQFEGRPVGREELARQIRQLLDGGSYNIGRHSAALEALNDALANVRTIAFRAAPELSEAVAAAAARLGKTQGEVIRDALKQYLPQGTSDPLAAQPRRQEPEGRRPTHPEIPIAMDALPEEEASPMDVTAVEPEPVASASTAPSPSPPPGLKPAATAPTAPPAASAVPAFMPGPGALRAAGLSHPAAASPSVLLDQSLGVVTEEPTAEEAAQAVDLTPKQKGADGEQAAPAERRWFGN